MAVSDEEVARRRKRMADLRQRATQLSNEIEEHQKIEQQQQRLANAIHASIAEAGDPVSVDKAIEMLDSFFETGKVPVQARTKDQGRR